MPEEWRVQSKIDGSRLHRSQCKLTLLRTHSRILSIEISGNLGVWRNQVYIRLLIAKCKPRKIRLCGIEIH